jgi:hypothetical protein
MLSLAGLVGLHGSLAGCTGDGSAAPGDGSAPSDALNGTPDNLDLCAQYKNGEAMSSKEVTPTVNGTVYTFTVGDRVFAVDAAKGGRIVTASLGGKNLLTAASGQNNNWGSTFWPSPQSEWNWPPPAELDPGAYAASICGTKVAMASETSPALGIKVTKEFSVDASTGVVTIVYGMVNRGTQARSLAPWEITRVPAGGLTFFPMGQGSPKQGTQDLLTLQMAAGAAWFAYDAAAIPREQKVFADGAEGWIAHVEDDLLLVKSFGDTTPAEAAPGESEIELYADGAHSYVEVENQGAYASIAPGATATWTVRWVLHKLDATVAVQAGSTDLLAVVRSLRSLLGG